MSTPLTQSPAIAYQDDVDDLALFVEPEDVVMVNALKVQSMSPNENVREYAYQVFLGEAMRRSRLITAVAKSYDNLLHERRVETILTVQKSRLQANMPDGRLPVPDTMVGVQMAMVRRAYKASTRFIMGEVEKLEKFEQRGEQSKHCYTPYKFIILDLTRVHFSRPARQGATSSRCSTWQSES